MSEEKKENVPDKEEPAEVLPAPEKLRGSGDLTSYSPARYTASRGIDYDFDYYYQQRQEQQEQDQKAVPKDTTLSGQATGKNYPSYTQSDYGSSIHGYDEGFGSPGVGYRTRPATEDEGYGTTGTGVTGERAGDDQLSQRVEERRRLAEVRKRLRERLALQQEQRMAYLRLQQEQILQERLDEQEENIRKQYKHVHNPSLQMQIALRQQEARRTLEEQKRLNTLAAFQALQRMQSGYGVGADYGGNEYGLSEDTSSNYGGADRSFYVNNPRPGQFGIGKSGVSAELDPPYADNREGTFGDYEYYDELATLRQLQKRENLMKMKRRELAAGLGVNNYSLSKYSNTGLTGLDLFDNPFAASNSILTRSGNGGLFGGLFSDRSVAPGMDFNTFALALLALGMVAATVFYQALGAQSGSGSGSAPRKTKKANKFSPFDWFDKLYDIVQTGLEDFEGKIDKIANGQYEEEDSWLTKMYKEYQEMKEEEEYLEEPNETRPSLQEGLEPPLLVDDEVAGTKSPEKVNNDLESSESPVTTLDKVHHQLFRRSTNFNNFIQDSGTHHKEHDDDHEILEIYEKNPGYKCQTKMWKCMSLVIEKGIEDVQSEPEGLGRLLKKHMLKVVFHREAGTFWDVLMQIPEARKFQRCWNKDQECQTLEVLKKEKAKTTGNSEDESEFDNNDAGNLHQNKRFLLVPEHMENLDSDDNKDEIYY